MAVSTKNQKIVCAESAGMCAICKKKLIETIAGDTKELLGEIAHIEGENTGSKRYNLNQSDKDRNSPGNLILLCPNDHTLIDRDDVTYTVEAIKGVKESHLNFISNSIKNELPNVTFAELQVAVSYLVSMDTPIIIDSSLEHLAPKEKINKNNLSAGNASLIAMGMARVRQVKDYLNTNPDVNFAERLRTRLSEYYKDLKKEEPDPNIIFTDMLDYIAEGSTDFRKKASALSILTYFFETCDIFEK